MELNGTLILITPYTPPNYGKLAPSPELPAVAETLLFKFKYVAIILKLTLLKEEYENIHYPCGAYCAMVNIAKFKKIDAEEALRMTNNKFIKRFQYIEEQVAKRGQELKDTPLEELEKYWQEAKQDKPPI